MLSPEINPLCAAVPWRAAIRIYSLACVMLSGIGQQANWKKISATNDFE
jgi:hypothetical protein